MKPKGETANLDGSDERIKPFGVSGCDTTPLLDVQKCVFNQMPVAIQVLVILARHLPALSRRNLGLHPLGPGLRDNRLAVIALVRDQMPSIDALNQLSSLRAISPGTLCNNNSDRHTMRIHGQMYLGIEPPLVRLMP